MRWLTRSAGARRPPRGRKMPDQPLIIADVPSPSISSRADLEGKHPERLTGGHRPSDAPPPATELESTGKKRPSESSAAPPILRANGQCDLADEFVTDDSGVDPSPPPARGQAPADPSDLPVPPSHEPDESLEAQKPSAEANELATTSTSLSDSANAASGCAPASSPLALREDSPSAPPAEIVDDAGEDLHTTPDKEDDAGALTSHAQNQAAESINSVSEFSPSSADHNGGVDHRSQRRQDRESEPRGRSGQKYRPRLRPSASPTAPSTPKTSQTRSQPEAGTLEAGLLLTFLPGAWGISLSVLLSRADGMPETLDVRVGDEWLSLYAIEEKLFEPVQPPNVDLIGSGFTAETYGDPVRRWVRTQRDLHAFSRRTGVSGFASVPRVLIGQENVILCKSELAGTVQKCAAATGSEPLLQAGGPGIPDGWLCFRGYRPRLPTDLGDVEELFHALNPLPDAAIELSGGIASARGTWMIGSPPVIRVLGVPPGPGDLTIDGIEALQSSNGAWTAPGWDSLGTHTIRLAGLSRSYEIAQIDEAWPSWPTSEGASFSACGAHVSAAGGVQALAIRGGPYWLLGASAGDLAFATRTPQGVSIAAPRFRPVWAVPPIGSGRQTPARSLPCRGEPRPPAPARTRREILQWCILLRGAGAPLDAELNDLWRKYRRLAQSLRRKWR